MKKNLKIVSAAAAALLAVAPVAATAVTANASVSGISGTSNQGTSESTNEHQIAINVNFNNNVKPGAALSSIDASKSTVTASLSGSTLTVPSGYTVKVAGQDKTDSTFKVGNTYTVTVSGLKINGVPSVSGAAQPTYTATDGDLSTTGSNAIHSIDFTNGVTYKYTFTMIDPNQTGTPYLVAKKTNTAISHQDIKYSQANNVKAIVNAIMAHTVDVSGGNAQGVPLEEGAVKTAVKTALKNAKVNLPSSDTDSFDEPANNVHFNIKIEATNGKTANFPVTLLAHKAAASDAPVITWVDTTAQNKYTNIKTNSADYKLDLNSTTTANDIANDFRAHVNGETNAPFTDVKVDSSNLNTAVAGKYQVVLSATNPAGKTSKFTVNVTVGNPGDTRYVHEDNTKIYNINGNNVTDSNKTLAKGAKVATFGTIDVNGTSYIRLNSADSNDFVLTSALSETSPTPESTKHVRVWNKKESYIYNEHHVRQGSGLRYKIGSGHNVVANEDGTPKVYTIAGGVKAYKLSEGYFKGQYVDVRNFTTKKAHASHVNNNHKKAVIRSRVFDVRGKAVKHMYIKKGVTIKVYGTKTIKGHKMYKIAKHNRYVKVANFR